MFRGVFHFQIFFGQKRDPTKVKSHFENTMGNPFFEMPFFMYLGILRCTWGYFEVISGTWGYLGVLGDRLGNFWVLKDTWRYFKVLWCTWVYLGVLGGTWGTKGYFG